MMQIFMEMTLAVVYLLFWRAVLEHEWGSRTLRFLTMVAMVAGTILLAAALASTLWRLTHG